jgi:hypothetical protein
MSSVGRSFLSSSLAQFAPNFRADQNKNFQVSDNEQHDMYWGGRWDCRFFWETVIG